MKTKTLLSIAAAASLIAFLSSLLVTQDLTSGCAALAMTMAVLTLIHEYTPRTHFVVTPNVRAKAARGSRPQSFTTRSLLARPRVSSESRLAV